MTADESSASRPGPVPWLIAGIIVEGLAFFFPLAALLLFHCATERGAALYYALCGILAGLAFLTRSQMLFFGFAIGVVLFGAALVRNARWTAPAVFMGGFLVAILPWVVYLTTSVRPFGLSALIGTYSEMPGLPMFDQQVPTSGPLAYIVDRLSGLLVMFNPLCDFSFVSSFGIAAFLVPIAAVYVVVNHRWRGGLTALATGVAGLLMCAVLLSSHNRYFLEWLFSYRHGLPFILLLVAAMSQLTGRYARATALVLVAISALMNVPRVVALTKQPFAQGLGAKVIPVTSFGDAPNRIMLLKVRR